VRPTHGASWRTPDGLVLSNVALEQAVASNQARTKTQTTDDVIFSVVVTEFASRSAVAPGTVCINLILSSMSVAIPH
jgi:hypothetical protein